MTDAIRGYVRRWGPTVGPVLAAMIAAAGVLWAASADHAAVQQTLETHDKAIDDHEHRIRCAEKTLPKIATDVQWIRESMERDERRGNP